MKSMPSEMPSHSRSCIVAFMFDQGCVFTVVPQCIFWKLQIVISPSMHWTCINPYIKLYLQNKANLRDLIAATGLVILLKFDQNHRFFSRVTLKFDGWPWKTIGHLFYTTSSFVHHYKSIGELKLRLQSGNTQFGSKIGDFLSCVTLKFDGWPWKTIGHLFYTTPSFVHHFKSIGEFKLGLQSGNAQFGSKWAIFCPV